MSSVTYQRTVRARIEQAARWQPRARSDGRLFERASELLEAARQLERLVSDCRTEQVDPAVLACLGAAFDSLANTTLMLRETAGTEPLETRVTDRDRVVELDRLLYAINQNLRFAAQATELGRETLAASIASSGV